MPADAWTDEVRAAAVQAVQIAAAKHAGSLRALRYFTSRALAHGVPLADVAAAAGTTEDAVRDLTDPAVAG